MAENIGQIERIILFRLKPDVPLTDVDVLEESLPKLVADCRPDLISARLERGMSVDDYISAFLKGNEYPFMLKFRFPNDKEAIKRFGDDPNHRGWAKQYFSGIRLEHAPNIHYLVNAAELDGLHLS